MMSIIFEEEGKKKGEEEGEEKREEEGEEKREEEGEEEGEETLRIIMVGFCFTWH